MQILFDCGCFSQGFRWSDDVIEDGKRSLAKCQAYHAYIHHFCIEEAWKHVSVLCTSIRVIISQLLASNDAPESQTTPPRTAVPSVLTTRPYVGPKSMCSGQCYDLPEAQISTSLLNIKSLSSTMSIGHAALVAVTGTTTLVSYQLIKHCSSFEDRVPVG